MTFPQLHRSPTWRGVITEQARATGIVMRPFFITIAGLCVLLDALVIGEAWREAIAEKRGVSQSLIALGYTPAESILFVAFALIMALMVWQDENVARRTYHWLMPVNRATHALAKVVAGWLWVMVMTLVILLNLVVVSAVVARINHGPTMHHAALWTYLIPFSATTIAYALASAAAVGARAPFVYVGGIPLIYAGLVTLLSTKFEWRWGYGHLLTGWTGQYGAFSVLGGGYEERLRAGTTIGMAVQTWIGSFTLWAGVALILLILTARHQARSR